MIDSLITFHLFFFSPQVLPSGQQDLFHKVTSTRPVLISFQQTPLFEIKGKDKDYYWKGVLITNVSIMLHKKITSLMVVH
jgi:hypothetical protein